MCGRLAHMQMWFGVFCVDICEGERVRGEGERENGVDGGC